MATHQEPRPRNLAIGAYGEKVAGTYLETRGAVIIDRNWRIREGEIDIVAELSNGVIAFVEVKTRSSMAFGHPLEAISSAKAHRLQRLALGWMATHSRFGQEYQIDCVSVLVRNDESHTIEYRANVL